MANPSDCRGALEYELGDVVWQEVPGKVGWYASHPLRWHPYDERVGIGLQAVLVADLVIHVRCCPGRRGDRKGNMAIACRFSISSDARNEPHARKVLRADYARRGVSNDARELP